MSSSWPRPTSQTGTLSAACAAAYLSMRLAMTHPNRTAITATAVDAKGSASDHRSLLLTALDSVRRRRPARWAPYPPVGNCAQPALCFLRGGMPGAGVATSTGVPDAQPVLVDDTSRFTSGAPCSDPPVANAEPRVWHDKRMRRVLEQDAASYSLLSDPRRRRIYLAIRRAGKGMTKDAVATSLGISPTLATFHLEKLLEGGFLEAHFAHSDVRPGRRVGRRAKYYLPSQRELSLTIPERRYEVVAEILAGAVVAADADVSAHQRALELAHAKGRQIGREFLAERGSRGKAGLSRSAVARLIGELGYEPRLERREILLGNCPFDALVSPPYLACELSERLLQGTLEGCQVRRLEPVLDHREGHCCVVLRNSPS